MLSGRNGWAQFAPNDMTLKEIKSELSAQNKSLDGCKEKLWTRLTALRCVNANSENVIKPFGGPALDVLVTKIITKKLYMLDSINVVVKSIKILLTKEIAGHVANYVEIPKYFGETTFRGYDCVCSWKCKQICLCDELQPPCSGWRHLHDWSSYEANYKDLENAWSAARKEWEIMQEPNEIKLAQDLVESAPSINAILPYDICELIADKIIVSNYEDPYKTIESKKELAKITVSTWKLLHESKESMKQTKKRLDRCGQSARCAALKSGKEYVLSPLIQKNKDILARDYEEKSNAYSALLEETNSLAIHCKDEGLVYSSRINMWVPA